MTKPAVDRLSSVSPVSPVRKPARARVVAKGRKAVSGSSWLFAGSDFRQAFDADALEQVRIVKEGVQARAVEGLAQQMAMSKERLVLTLGLARATVDRKARDDKALSADDSSKVLGMARLVGQAQAMVEESGDPAGFDAPRWVAAWLERPVPALGGRKPAELMDTAEGRTLVSTVMARMQSAAYS